MMTRRVLVRVLIVVMALAMVAGVCGGVWVATHRGFRALAQGNEAYEAGQWLEAKRFYQWYLARQSDDVEILERYAEVCLKNTVDRREMLQSAAHAYFRLAVLDNYNRDKAVRAATFCEEHDLWETLGDFANNFLRRDPNDTQFVYWKALAAEHLGDTKTATDLYTQLIAAGPCPPRAYRGLASLQAAQGLSELADDLFANAIAAAPNDMALLTQHALYLLGQRRFAEAKADIDRVLAAEPQNADAQLAAGRIAMNANDPARAAEIAESILDSAPNVEACRLLVVANARLGSREKTLERLAALPEAFVLDRPEAYFLLADHQIAAQRYDDAHATIARFRESHPAHAAAFDYLEARESLVRGEAATAIEQFKILGEKAPQMQPVRLQLSIAYAQAGQLELARQTLEVYRTAYPADEDGIALWNSMFGESSSESLQAKAGALLGDANANAATMVETANLMLNREHPEGADKRDALAKSLLEESYKKAGSDALPFSALFEFYITRKDLAAADALLTQGEQNGVAAFALSRARAQRALADNDVQTAKSFLMADLDRADITGREVGEWAGLFSRAAYTEIGIEILETFAARAPDAAGKADREIEKIDFVLRSGDAAKALELARELAPSFNGLPGAIERLADAQMRAVEGLIRKGDVNSVALAQAAVHDALERNPEDTRAQENAVRLMLLPAKTDWSTFERADRLCATLRAKLPNDAAVLALSSEVARRSGQKARALEYASKAVKLAGTAPEPLMALARAQIASGLHNDAATTLNQTLALNPRDLNAQVLLVQAFGGARRFHEAEQVVEGLTAGMPATPERDTMLDSLRLSLANSRKDWPTVERLARSLSATDTTNFDFVMLLVRALAEQGRRTEGEEVLSRAAAETNTPRSWTDAGNYFMSRGQGRDDFAQASTMFTRAIMLSPNYPPALLGQIDIQGRTADISAALGLCDRYIAQSPDDSSILLAKAKLLSALPDRTQDALAAADDVIERVEDPDALYLRGTLCVRAGRFEDAIRDLQRVAEMQGVSTASVEAAIARAYVGLQKADLARTHLDAALRRVADGDKGVDVKQLDAIAAAIEKGAP